MEREPFLAWPETTILKRNLALSLLVTLLFVLVYGGSSYIAGLHGLRWRVHTDWELGLPFFAPLTAVYLSLNLVMGLAPWVLRGKEDFLALVKTMLAELFIGGLFFLLFPAELKFPTPSVEGFWAPFLLTADTLNLDYNLLPSLHVAFALSVAEAYAARRGLWGRVLLRSWAWAVCASTVLTHQHHVADVAAGAALAWGANRRFLGSGLV